MAEAQRLTLQDIADLLGGRVEGDPTAVITGIGTLRDAQPGEISFLANPKYESFLTDTRATAVLITPSLAEKCSTHAIILDDPYRGYAHLSHRFDPEPRPEPGIHATAVVAESAVVDASATVGPHAVIDSEAKVGPGVRIGAGAVIGARCVLGEDTQVAANVTLYHDVRVGARCRISSGAVIGSDGFGYANHQGQWERIAQIGGVDIGDDVDVGANTSIDRGAIEATRIGNGVKLDNMIQIAHNVRIGDHTAMAAFVGIAGSTTIGSHCVFGGASGVGGHLEIGDQVHLTGMTMVTRSLKEPGVYSSGTGVETNRNWRRNVVRFRQLDEMAKRVKALEKKLDEQS